MDDYSISSLGESKNEWCARLVNTLTPPIIQGLKSIFLEAWNLCEENTQKDKYLMTFQTFLTRVPKWNATIIENEKKRIYEISGCSYLEELITCVHIIQLKALSCVRVGQKQKKVDINIPSVDDFIHKIYINSARKIYTTIYLFEKNIPPLETQKRNRELECIIKECILDTVRESIPVENILRAYMDETTENEVDVKVVDEVLPMPEEEIPAQVPAAAAQAVTAQAQLPASAQAQVPASAQGQVPVPEKINNPKIKFSDIDMTVDATGYQSTIDAPKTIERLDQLSIEKLNRKEDDEDSEDGIESLTIGENITLDIFDINELDKPMNLRDAPILDDIEILT